MMTVAEVIKGPFNSSLILEANSESCEQGKND